jgi:hypothetical protein
MIKILQLSGAINNDSSKFLMSVQAEQLCVLARPL